MSVWALLTQGQHIHITNVVFVCECSYVFIFDEIETGSAAETVAAGASCILYGGSLSCCSGGCSIGRATEAVAKAGMDLVPVLL